MYITKINLKNFRNYKNLLLEPSTSINILVGNNAQGKTNLLESIYYAGSGKSFRTNRNQDLLNWNFNDFFVIDLETVNFNRKLVLSVKFEGTNKKSYFINGVQKRKLTEVIDNFKIVLFAPDDLNLIKGGPSERRKFLDSHIVQLSPKYYYDLKQYEKILVQRNALLKAIKDRKATSDFLEVWDNQLWEYGTKIIIKRIETLKKMMPLFKKIHLQLTESEAVDITYLSSFNLEKGLVQEDIKNSFQKATKALIKEEIKRGITLTGPHRDDLGFFINEKSIQNYGSQGQQRTTVLSLKLVELQLIKEEHGFYPILLLDDVMSELDQKRRNYLLSFIKEDLQTFITTTSLEFFDHEVLKESNIICIDDGNIISEECK